MKNRIRKIRKDNELTMKQFGDRIGITRSSVSLLESGKNNPSEQTIRLICQEFNVRKEWLRTGEEPMTADSDLEFSDICFKIGIKDERAKQAIEKYWKLSDEDKELFWKFADKFIKREG